MTVAALPARQPETGAARVAAALQTLADYGLLDRVTHSETN